jgi:7,8-dihydropterin-6-yl-methyl-4-(beta-D-ribofuranosyl)aminobenzene 5'-phosphate synthase
MEIKTIFDNETVNKKLRKGWGLSFLVGQKILFDTGENGFWLLENMRNLNVNTGRIKAVVISHDHWDHTGGLWEVLKSRKGLKVYACPNFSSEFKKKVKELNGELMESDRATRITENIYTTGEIAGDYKGMYMPEQALVVETNKGLAVITGCSHPGVVKMVKEVKKDFDYKKIYLIFGGFHLIDKYEPEIRSMAEELREMGVEKIGPAHCSGYDAKLIFKEIYGDKFIPIKAGVKFEI